MELKFPENLDDWNRWSASQRPVRSAVRWAKTSVRRIARRPEENVDIGFSVFVADTAQAPAELVVALESASPTVIAALLQPAERAHAHGISAAIVAPQNIADFLNLRGYTCIEQFVASESQVPDSLGSVKQVLAVGHFMAAGSWAFDQSKKMGWGFNVVQHGLNTPFVPPLPAGCTLFSFTDADAEFWISGRTDIKSHTVGAQIFFEARQKAVTATGSDNEILLFLGQMHGAEISRFSFARAGYEFCRNHSAIYRPHPAEKDKLSQVTHKLWAKKGIKIDSVSAPLNELNNPVVSVFSTGVLEAAIRGIPAWVYHPNPPSWLTEFWNRNGMNQWGSEPTPAPLQPDIEPSEHIARIIANTLEK